MRKLAISAMALAVLTGTPFLVSAQQTDDETRRTAEAADREDRGEWGWLGLLGLAGLAGLKPTRSRCRNESGSRAGQIKLCCGTRTR